MSVVVTVSNELDLMKLKNFLGAKDENEAVDIVIEKTVRDFEEQSKIADLPDDFFEDLFAEETLLSDSESIQAVIKEREESKF